MTRRELLSGSVAFGLSGSLRAEDLQFPGVRYREYSRCLPDYLRAMASEAYARRNREIDKLTSTEAIKRRQEWVRQTFWDLTGGKPEPTPLHTRSTGGFERPGYRLEKLIYQSQPEIFVPANLYVPTKGTPPFPGILFQMGHSPNGKAWDSYQRCCQGLVKLGYIVLAFDPMGQGERIYYPDASGTRTRLRSSDDEHTRPGRQMVLIGETATRMQVWDAMRSLDVLASHPKADRTRLASAGQSGGATVTMLMLAVDDRLSAAAVCSGNTENMACANFIPPGSVDDAEQNFINAGPAGFDRWDLFYPFAPKPLLITVSDKDSFGTYSPNYIVNGWEEYGKLKRIYQTLGKPDHLAWSDTPLPHGLSYDSRLQVYNWFERHLKGAARQVEEEPPISPEADERLWVSKTGNAVTSFGGQTPFRAIRSREIRQAPASLKSLVGSQFPGNGLRPTVLSRVPSRDIYIEALDIASAEAVWLPAWMFVPRKADPGKPVLLMLHDSGRNRYWHEEEIYQRLARAGYQVCAADVRGVGDMAPEFGRGAPGYQQLHNDEESYAWASLILGKSLLGQRVTDMLALAAALRTRGSRIVLNAHGRLTVPAAIAASLDPSIERLYLSGGLISFRSILETENYTEPFSNFCMSMLKHADLPEIVSGIAPRKIVVSGPVDGSGKKVNIEAVRDTYRDAIKKGHLTLREQADWSFGEWL